MESWTIGIEPDPPGSDIRDGPNASDTQRDEWLLKEARPK